jgi:hypothetical protein
VVKLRVPPGCKSISYMGHERTIGPENSIDVDDAVAEILVPHGFSLAIPAISIPQHDGSELDKVAELNRRELFSVLRSRGVSVSLPITNEALREAVRNALKQ